MVKKCFIEATPVRGIKFHITECGPDLQSYLLFNKIASSKTHIIK